jgi:hypothetical protein
MSKTRQRVILTLPNKSSLTSIATLLRGKITYIVILLLAFFPPVLVMLDRWFDVQWIHTQFLSTWCYPATHCNSILPAYFIIILPVTISLVLLFIFSGEQITALLPVKAPLREQNESLPSPCQRRIGGLFISISIIWIVWRIVWVWQNTSTPGWNYLGANLLLLCGWTLRGIPFNHVAVHWKENRRKYCFLLINHVSLIGGLASVYTSSKSWSLFLLIFLVSVFAFRKSLRDISSSYWLLSFALIIFTLGINHWSFSIVGDEYAFFRNAGDIVQHQNLSNIGAHLFNGQGVYQTHPYLSSLIQAVSMKIFGIYNFGWRFSNIYLTAIAIGLCHSVFRSFLREQVATLAGLFLAFSQYLIAFGKIGYNNLQAFLLLALVLYFTRGAIARKRNVDFAILGSIWGLCFYVYPAALFLPPISFLLLLFYHFPISRSAIRNWGISILCLLFLLLPLFSQTTYWLNKIPGTFLYTPALSQNTGNIAHHLSSNLLSAMYSFLYAPQETHFVAGSYVDPLSAALALIGLSLLLSKYRSDKFVTFLIASFVYLLFFLGATHDRSVPSTTRMFLLLPWFAIFTAIGFTWIIQELRSIRWRRVLTALTLVVCLVLNLYQAFPLAQKRMAYRYHSFQVLFLRDAPQLLTPKDGVKPLITILNQPDIHVLESLYELLDIYQIIYTREQLTEMDAENFLQDDLDEEWLSDTHSLIIITPWVYGELRASIERFLTQTGKQRCEIKNSAGNIIYVVWESRSEPK